jgi:hypothetical protein
MNGSEDHSKKKESVRDSLVLKITEKISCSGFMNAWKMFSNQDDKWSCSD